MANLSLTFQELYEEIQKYLGTYASGSAAATDVTDSKFCVNRAYSRYCSYYDWTFLTQERVLTTTSGQWKYELPSDFNYLVIPKLTYDSDDGYPEITPRSVIQIKDDRSANTYNSYPQFYALQAGTYDKNTGQGWDILLYPTPDAVYRLQYVCKIHPEKLVNDADIPIGGAVMSDCLLELCLAYAEAYKDERQAVHSEVVNQILGPAKMMDNRRRAQHLGSMSHTSWLGSVDFDKIHSGDVIVSSG